MDIRKAFTAACIAALLVAPVGAGAQTGRTPAEPRVQALVEILRLNGVPVYDFDGPPLLTQPGAAGLAPLLEELIKRREQAQRPGSPRAGVDVLGSQLAALEALCRQGGDCAPARGLAAVVAALEAAAIAHPDCSPAAEAYGPYYTASADPPVAIARRYDLACLGSVEPRKLGGQPRRDPLPAVYRQGGRAGGAEGALRAVGLLEVAGVPFCGALLRNDRTLVTARHCFEGVEGAFWRAGQVRVRPADGRGGPWRIGATLLKSGAAGSVKAGEDWAVAAIDTADPIGAPNVELAEQRSPGEVTVLAHFRHHTAADYADGASLDPWRRGLRWPRPGLCQVEEVRPDCLRLVCQTVRGFSGAPIFEAAPAAADAPIKVVGIVSRAATGPELGCGVRSSVVTLAASAVRAAP